jgi:hypothetical protein
MSPKTQFTEVVLTTTCSTVGVDAFAVIIGAISTPKSRRPNAIAIRVFRGQTFSFMRTILPRLKNQIHNESDKFFYLYGSGFNFEKTGKLVYELSTPCQRRQFFPV